MSAVVKADPDGYTLVMASGGDVSLNPALIEKMPYDVERDLVPISGVSDAPIVLVANSHSPYKSVADVIAASKSNPGSIDIGTPGIGSITHLVLEWLALSTGTKFQNVPFKGGGPGCSSADCRSCASRCPGEFFGRTLRAKRNIACSGGHLDNALLAQSGMADTARTRHP